MVTWAVVIGSSPTATSVRISAKVSGISPLQMGDQMEWAVQHDSAVSVRYFYNDVTMILQWTSPSNPSIHGQNSYIRTCPTCLNTLVR